MYLCPCTGYTVYDIMHCGPYNLRHAVRLAQCAKLHITAPARDVRPLRHLADTHCACACVLLAACNTVLDAAHRQLHVDKDAVKARRAALRPLCIA
eukprot:4980630-Pleurochrysis_carterae.AAC.3